MYITKVEGDGGDSVPTVLHYASLLHTHKLPRCIFDNHNTSTMAFLICITMVRLILIFSIFVLFVSLMIDSIFVRKVVVIIYHFPITRSMRMMMIIIFTTVIITTSSSSHDHQHPPLSTAMASVTED